MKKILFAILLPLTVMIFSFENVNTPSLAIGSDMPKADVKMQDISGKEISLKDATKKNGLLVMFSCNTCPFVIRNQKRTKDVCAFAQKNNIGVIILNANEAGRAGRESPDAMKDYAKAQGYNWFYAVDKNNELADAFGASRTPECFLFNKDSKLVYHGAIDDNPQDATAVTKQHLKEAITEMAAGKEVTVKETRSIGCGIKRAQ